MAAFFLTWMWLARALAFWCAGFLVYAIIAGDGFAIAAAAICLPVNAVTAELSRRQLERAW